MTAPSTGDTVAQALAKPLLRGWIHTVMAPLAAVIGIVLLVVAPTPGARAAVAVFAVTTVVLFTTSAIYHRGTWTPRWFATLRRLDHSNIFLVIAGTYTPLAVMLLPVRTATVLLAVVWGGALAGIGARVFWLNAPRWFYVPVYVALGWVAVWFMPAFWSASNAAVVWLIIAGGLGYTLGALAYGFKRPNPSPRYFGYHEIFHVGTVVGYTCHAVAVGAAVLLAR
ncbi:PAQR family membrane homeostasis protein TrhA [Pseudactinotalea sp. Z1748]|uniref:PAQR family membrane homeostasis protein TrhA n=1 Tax=Pseudactinotalea sp. Z1748 TaxID=3413027 RepID=UPI003C7D840B